MSGARKELFWVTLAWAGIVAVLYFGLIAVGNGMSYGYQGAPNPMYSKGPVLPPMSLARFAFREIPAILGFMAGLAQLAIAFKALFSARETNPGRVLGYTGAVLALSTAGVFASGQIHSGGSAAQSTFLFFLVVCPFLFVAGTGAWAFSRRGR